MSLWPHRYHMLVCSLPPLPPRLDGGKLPISRERLQDRLRMLRPEDAEELQRMRDILGWSDRYAEHDDAAVVKRYRELIRHLRPGLLREVALAAVDVRMVMTALRRRRRGLGPPPVGIGQWADHIRRNFTAPDFRLGQVYPRLPELQQVLDRGEVLNFHRALVQTIWRYLHRRADAFHFEFEAVVLYVARWELLRHWLELEAEPDRAAFERLVSEALGEHAELYA